MSAVQSLVGIRPTAPMPIQVEANPMAPRDVYAGTVEDFSRLTMPRPAAWVGNPLNQKFTPPQFIATGFPPAMFAKGGRI